jgi:lipopolysaccharide O-acetyltransferase
MSSALAKVLRNLRRPLPDLWGYLTAKVSSFFWARQLRTVGRRFHVSRGSLIQGGRCIDIGDRFFGGPHLWIEAVREYVDFRFEPRIVIGANVTCSHFVHIAATRSVVIGDGVLLGSGVHITDHAHGTYAGDEQDSPDTPPAMRRPSSGRPVVLGQNVWLGDGVVVLPGVSIGDGTIVGANSVVSKNLGPHLIAVGAPARAIKRYDPASRKWVPIEVVTGS